MKPFIILTLIDTGKPLHINANSIDMIYQTEIYDTRIHGYLEATCICTQYGDYKVKESHSTVMRMIEQAWEGAE